MSRPKEIRFTKAVLYGCPAYKDYYIQDRAIGKDVYGHEAYEYALFRRNHFKVVRRFRTRKQAYQYVSDITGLDQWDVKMRGYRIITNDRECLGVLHNDTMYRIMRRTREVAVRPSKDEQLTGWYDKYNDCLSAAKQIVKSEEGKI